MPFFGQFIIGPPGSGKTTYCKVIFDFLSSKGRKVVLVNLDPANEAIPSTPHVQPLIEETSQSNKQKHSEPSWAIDVRNLVRIEDPMHALALGPNGSLVYCVEFLRANLNWLIEKIRALGSDNYFLFDCPGQVELYTQNESMRAIVERLVRAVDLRLCCVCLLDSYYCADPHTFLSALLATLSTMLHLELPHVNVLSKIDLIERRGQSLAFGLEFYTELPDLQRLLECDDLEPAEPGDDPERMDHSSAPRSPGSSTTASSASTASAHSTPATYRAFVSRHRKLSAAICELVSDYGLLSFHPLDISCAESVRQLVERVDTAIGYYERPHAADGAGAEDEFERVFGPETLGPSGGSSAEEREASRADLLLLLQEKYTTQDSGVNT